MTPDQFKQRLTDIVKPDSSNVLSYSSDANYPVEVVALPWWGYKGKIQDMEPDRFDCQIREALTLGQATRWRKLQSIRGIHWWKELKVPRAEPSEFDYYFVTRVGFFLVGIKCRVIERILTKT